MLEYYMDGFLSNNLYENLTFFYYILCTDFSSLAKVTEKLAAWNFPISHSAYVTIDGGVYEEACTRQGYGQ